MTFKKKIFIIICCVCLLGLTLFYPLANASTYQWRDNTNQYQEQFDNDPSQPDTIPPYEIPEVIVPDVDERDTRYDGIYNFDFDSTTNEYIETYLHLDRNARKMMFIFQFWDAYDMSQYEIYIYDEWEEITYYPGLNRAQATQINFYVGSCDDITFSGASFFDMPWRIDLKAQETLPLPSTTTTTTYFYRDNVNYRIVLEWDIIQSNPIEEGMEWDITLFNYTLFASTSFAGGNFSNALCVNAIGDQNLYYDVLFLLLDFSPDFLHTYTQGYEAGYTLGYENGYKNGYHDSYLKVVNGGITSSWFTGLFDGVQGFLDIRFGQISIGAIILIPLSITIVWFIIRQFRGGGGGD